MSRKYHQRTQANAQLHRGAGPVKIFRPDESGKLRLVEERPVVPAGKIDYVHFSVKSRDKGKFR